MKTKRKGREWTPEQKAALRERLAKGRAQAAERKAQAQVGEPEAPVTLSDLLPPPPPEDDDEILSAAEKAAIRSEARKKVQAEKREAVRRAFAKEALDDARRAENAMPADEALAAYNAEMVTIFIQMPTLRKGPGLGEHPPEPIVLDGKIFRSGTHRTVTRAQAVTLLEIMDKNRQHVNQVDGRSRAYYHEGRGQMIYQGGPASGGVAGPSFDAVHRRPS